MQKHMFSVGIGINALELRRYLGKKRTSQIKSFRKYLKNTEKYTLPGHPKKEDDLNEIFSDLKENMSRKKYKKSLLLVSKLYINLERIHDEIYPKKL
jgi:hypothetical protein